MQYSEKYYIPILNRDFLKRMSDKIHNLISEINIESDESLQGCEDRENRRRLDRYININIYVYRMIYLARSGYTFYCHLWLMIS